MPFSADVRASSDTSHKWSIQLFRLISRYVLRSLEDWITSAGCAFGGTLSRRPTDGSSQWLVGDVHVHPHGPHLDPPPFAHQPHESHQRRRWRQDALRHIALPRFALSFVFALKARFLARTWTCLASTRKTIQWMAIVCHRPLHRLL